MLLLSRLTKYIYLLRFKKALKRSIVTAMAKKEVLSNLLLILILMPKPYSKSLRCHFFCKTKAIYKPSLLI